MEGDVQSTQCFLFYLNFGCVKCMIPSAVTSSPLGQTTSLIILILSSYLIICHMFVLCQVENKREKQSEADHGGQQV